MPRTHGDVRLCGRVHHPQKPRAGPDRPFHAVEEPGKIVLREQGAFLDLIGAQLPVLGAHQLQQHIIPAERWQTCRLQILLDGGQDETLCAHEAHPCADDGRGRLRAGVGRAVTHRCNHLCPYVQRAAIALTEKGVSFARRYVDLSAKPDWFLAISPLGKVPLLIVTQDDGAEAVCSRAP